MPESHPPRIMEDVSDDDDDDDKRLRVRKML